MRISDREIERSLRLLAEQTSRQRIETPVDGEINRLVLGRLEGVPDIRADLVLPLKRAVRENRYRVPEEMVARMMLGRCLADHLR